MKILVRVRGLIILSAVVTAVLLNGCNSTSENPTERTTSGDAITKNFSGVIGNQWKLAELRLNGVNTGFNRNRLSGEDARNVFTLNFDSKFAAGTGAPNFYSAPYSLNGDNGISVSHIISTLMAPIFEPEGLLEHDFFNYMQNVYEWKLVNRKLELKSRVPDGGEAILIFTL